MTCLVWRCPRTAAQDEAWCERHAPATRAVRGPSGPDAARWADLMDPTLVEADVAAHNASLVTNVLLDALR